MIENKPDIFDIDSRFFKLIANSYSGITLLNRELRVIYRTPSAERITGWTTKKREESTMYELTHPQDKRPLSLLLDRVLRQPGLSETLSYRIQHHAGEYIWIECTYTNMLDEPGINAIVCNFIDITDKKRVEELLKQNAHELSAYKYALDEAAIVSITDENGIITEVNDNFCKISGYSREELIGQDHRIVNSGHHSKASIKQMWQTIAKGELWHGEFRNKAKNGSYYWVDATIVPFLNEQGTPYQYVAIRSDITERKLNEERINENARFIRTITDNMPAMIAYWGTDLKCRFANKPHLNWFGKTAREMTGISKRELLGEHEFELHQQQIENVLQGHAESFERTFVNATGNTMQTYTHYIPDVDGEVVKGFYALIIDVTEIKRAELEIRSKNAQITDLLANITDGFIALDKDFRHTYVNKRASEIAGKPVEALIGKSLLEVFPEMIDSPLYKLLLDVKRTGKSFADTSYFEPLGIWLENRIYATENGISIFFRDVTKKKEEEQHLRLLESVITNTTDAVLITDADLDEPGPRIIYTNEAFTNMSGYTADELIGKTPRILQGPKSDRDELKRLSQAMRRHEHCETTIINYKKDGTEFWINFSVSPVFDNSGHCSHFVAIEKDITARKKTENQIEQLNERFTMISKATNDALSEWNFEKQEMWWSESFFEMFGFDPSQPMPPREEWLKKIQPHSREVVARIIHGIENEGLSEWQEELDYYKPDGSEGTLFHRGFCIRDAQGHRLRTLGSYQDITHKKNEERQRAQLAKAISDSLRERNTILESIGDVFFALDKDWNITYWNSMAEKVLGKTRGAVLNKDFRKIYAYAKGYIPLIKYQEAMETHEAVYFEYHSEVLNTWFEISVFPSADGLSVYMKVVNDRKNAEIIVQSAFEEKVSILESIGDAFFAVDGNWTVTYWNKMAEKVLQVEKGDILAHNLWDIFKGSVGSLSYSKYHEAIETNQAVHFEDHFEPLNSWYEISAYPTGNGLSVYFKDVTERKQSDMLLLELNQNLQKQAKELSISNAELEQFAYVASHDLQEPLRMVTGFLSQLERKYGETIDDKGKQYIHFAVDGAKRMRQIILDLLEFSRVGTGENSVEEVDVDKLISDIIALYRQKIEDKGARIVFNGMPVIQSYMVPLRQVFQNLIGNSLKYQKPGNIPVINIRCKETAKHYQFSVKDNGIGIDQEYFDKIFIIFQRLHNKDEYAGTGMGLAVTKKIIENMGGRIWLESAEGIGSTFYFTILKNNL